MKHFSIIPFLVLLIACQPNTKTIYVDGTAPVDSNNFYRVMVDKEGNIIDEYKSSDLKKVEAENKLDSGDGINAKIIKLDKIGVMDTTTSILNGQIEGLDSENESLIYLENNDKKYSLPIDKSKFRFKHIDSGKYSLRIKINGRNKWIDSVNVGTGVIYRLIIKVEKE